MQNMHICAIIYNLCCLVYNNKTNNKFYDLFHIFVTYTNTNVFKQTKKGEYKHKYIQLKKGRI